MHNIINIFLIILIAGCSAIPQKKIITSLSIDLPTPHTWVNITQKEHNGYYIKEWIKKGETPESYDWIITEQRLPIKERVSPTDFHKIMFKAAKQSCFRVDTIGPKEIQIEGNRLSIGKIICSKLNEKPYGTVTYQKVFIENDSTVYVLTSELKTHPTKTLDKYDNRESLKYLKTLSSNIRKSENFIIQNPSFCFANQACNK